MRTSPMAGSTSNVDSGVRVNEEKKDDRQSYRIESMSFDLILFVVNNLKNRSAEFP
ncbi:hypothetical protein [Rivularia sp. PCC 7116]|uniref:hypothetical protein n=1 Tax=Rivularia sp. PCC 7116 TaxID=373994 RepID=UPI0018DEDF03|nr:hypothetical protein [Rivularia sp. PCC 7116]